MARDFSRLGTSVLGEQCVGSLLRAQARIPFALTMANEVDSLHKQALLTM